MQRGDLSAFKDWTAPQVVDALHKLCHDLICVKNGALPRFFAPASLPSLPLPARSPRGLDLWAKSLAATRRTVEHPFNAGLMLESLVAEAKTALNSAH
jgi:DNA polymerase III subunit delta'